MVYKIKQPKERKKKWEFYSEGGKEWTEYKIDQKTKEAREKGLNPSEDIEYKLYVKEVK